MFPLVFSGIALSIVNKQINLLDIQSDRKMIHKLKKVLDLFVDYTLYTSHDIKISFPLS